MFTDQQCTQLWTDFKFIKARWLTEGKPTPSDSDAQIISERAAGYGALQPGSVTPWVRAVQELAAEKAIRLKKPIAQPVPIPSNFQDQINAMTPNQLLSTINPASDGIRDRLPYDPQFAEWYSRWSNGERPEGSNESGEPEVVLSREQYYSIPAHVCARRYASSLAFRTAVDALFGRGEIRQTNIVSDGSR